MIRVIVCRGMQSSGKTTWAKEFIKENQDYKRVSRDDIRHMTNGYVFTIENEKIVTEIEYDILSRLILLKHNIVIDKMNLNQEAFERDKTFIQLAAEFGDHDVEFEVINFPVTLEEAIKRDKKREFQIGEKVIRQTYARYQEDLEEMMNVSKSEYDPKLPDCVICDIDGTLAFRGNRNPFDFSCVKRDLVNEPIKQLLQLIIRGSIKPVEIIIFSGRDDICEKDTREWLNHYDIEFDQLYMRKTGDKRKDSIIKKELYNYHINHRYNCLYWVDDRRQVIDMVRNELGLTCLDVAGNDF